MAAVPNQFPVLTLSLVAATPKAFTFPDFDWDEVFIQNRDGLDMQVSKDDSAAATQTDPAIANSFWTQFGGDADKYTRDDIGPSKQLFFETAANSVVEFSFRRLGIKR